MTGLDATTDIQEHVCPRGHSGSLRREREQPADFPNFANDYPSGANSALDQIVLLAEPPPAPTKRGGQAI